MDELDLTWYDMENIRRVLKEHGHEYLYKRISKLMEDNDKAELFTVYVKE
jgi:hypothetical protein